MTFLSAKAIQTLIVREIRDAGGSITEPDLYAALEHAGVKRDKTGREVKHLMQATGQVVRITRDGVTTLRAPERYVDAA